jgi:hypothetical protein
VHLLISTNLIADLPAMSKLGYSSDESESYSDSGSCRCIMDRGDEASGPLQGKSTIIHFIYIFLCCLPHAVLQFSVALTPSSYVPTTLSCLSTSGNWNVTLLFKDDFISY